MGRLRLRRLLHPERFRQARSLSSLFQPCNECERNVSRINAVTRATATGTRSSSGLAGAGPPNPGRGEQVSARGSAQFPQHPAERERLMDRPARQEQQTRPVHQRRREILASSGSSRNIGNTNGAGRNPATASQIMDRLASTSHAQVMSHAAVGRFASSSGRSFSSTASSRSLIGRSSSYGGGGSRSYGGTSVEVAVASMAAAMEVVDTVKKKHLMRPPQSKQ